MPGTRCTVAVCNNSYEKTKRAGIRIMYHQFPKAQPVRNIWIERCGRAGKWNPDSCHICSIHFSENDYRQDTPDFSNKPGAKRLRPTAIPSLFLEESPPINITLLAPRKRRKTSLSDKTPTYSNEDNIMYSQDTSSHIATISNYLEDSKNDELFYTISEMDDLAGINMENMQSYSVGKHKKNEKLETQEESCYSSKKQCILMRNITTETAPDYFINNYQRLVDENKKLKNKLVNLNVKHEKLLLNMKFLESKMENLKLSALIQHPYKTNISHSI